jgi:hypothetical protein
LLTQADVQSGLLARFAIIMPNGKPDRMDYFAPEEPEGLSAFNRLVIELSKLRRWSTEKPRAVHFNDGVLAKLEEIAVEIENAAKGASETARVMLHRLTPMGAKVAALLAAGWPWTTKKDELIITVDDAEGAVTILRRWMKDALTFASRVGENDFERNVQSFARMVQERGTVPRKLVARNCHVE